MDNLIQVLVVEAGKTPYAKMIPNTLQAQQELVGGYIEVMGFDGFRYRSVDIMMNEEAKRLGLPLNRVLNVIDGRTDREYRYYGTFFIVAHDRTSGNALGLTDEEIIKYRAMFSGFVNHIID
jgi:hypothetical protein